MTTPHKIILNWSNQNLLIKSTFKWQKKGFSNFLKLLKINSKEAFHIKLYKYLDQYIGLPSTPGLTDRKAAGVLVIALCDFPV